MEYVRKKLVEEALREGYNLTLEAISTLESLQNPIEVLREVIKYLKTTKPDVIVINNEHIGEVGSKTVESAYAFSEVVFEKSLLKEWTPSIDIDERYLKHYEIEGKIVEFQNYFNSRYAKLKNILEQRGGPSSRLTDALKSLKGTELFLVVMLLEKKETEQSVILEVEDNTSTTRIVIPKKDSELIKKAEKLLLDQVFGVRVVKINNTLIPRDIFLPDIPIKSRRIDREAPEVSIVLVSDLHVGSKKFRRDSWEEFLDWLNNSRDPEAKRVGYLLIAGDIVDGVGIFPHQEKELEYTSVVQQIEELNRLLSEIPKHIKVIISVGNHDPVEKALPQPPLSKKYRAMLEKDREYVFIGNPASIKVEGRRLLVYHGQSLDDIIQHLPNVSYSILGREIKNVLEVLLQCRHLAPIYGENTPILPTPEDLLVIEDVPDIVHTGHVHVAYVGNYREVLLVNSGTWQDQTSYQRELGLEPTVGTMVLVDLKTLTAKLKKFT
ncbi:MAG: DNA-directed DNA polymerase II small subunit [Aigarchaeota archaeon]|nr:DNA-directed DNA polymerase II small subunit [Aigarchaeota archaeon]MCX8192363.1 DNA-directed DNA polymerase II small subunit [Nitrososphaeria archaeon]MDW7986968.1 DNA-directed DNA polymerase II small subunit [Nitrososphaerota archaeon]